jgi:hypothetical protein
MGGDPVVVRLCCELCKRKGAYRLARLATKYGRRSSWTTSGPALERLPVA